jgi:hypothetical protein
LPTLRASKIFIVPPMESISRTFSALKPNALSITIIPLLWKISSSNWKNLRSPALHFLLQNDLLQYVHGSMVLSTSFGTNSSYLSPLSLIDSIDLGTIQLSKPHTPGVT